MKQIFRDILFLALIPITFVVLLLEMRLQLTPFQHKLMQMFIIFIIYILVALWIHFDLKIKEQKMNKKMLDQLKMIKIEKSVTQQVESLKESIPLKN
jgi:hypothetical protein